MAGRIFLAFLVLAASAFSALPALAQVPVLTTTAGGTGEGLDAGVNILLPLWQSDTSLVFLNPAFSLPRAAKGTGRGSQSGSLGIGRRSLILESSPLFPEGAAPVFRTLSRPDPLCYKGQERTQPERTCDTKA